MPLAQITILVSALLGWSDIEIQPSRGDRAAAAYRSVVNLDRPTDRTVETLRRYGLEHATRLSAATSTGCCSASRSSPSSGPSPSWSTPWPSSPGSRRSGSTASASRRRSTATSTPPPTPTTSSSTTTRCWPSGRKPADPRYRQAMELYNAGVDHLIRAAMTRDEIQPRDRQGHLVQVPRRRAEAPVRPAGVALAAGRRPQAPPRHRLRGQRPEHATITSTASACR